MAKVLLSVDDDLLAEVDALAVQAGLSRSAWVRQVLRREVGLPAAIEGRVIEGTVL